MVRRIIVAKFSETAFEARVKGFPDKVGHGTSLEAAVGSLVTSWPDEAGLEIEVREDPFLTQ